MTQAMSGLQEANLSNTYIFSKSSKQTPSRPVDPNPHPIAQRLAVVIEVLIGLAAYVLRQHTATLCIQAGGVEVPVRLVRIPCP